MNQPLTQKEWGALSAYLDEALTAHEQQQLERQLQARPELRAALHELRQTRQLLRQTPVLRVPRNFTLTPEMVGSHAARPRSYSLFQIAFAMASVLFILAIIGEFTLGSLSTASPVAMQAPVETLTIEETVLEEQVPEEALQAQEVAEPTADVAPEMEVEGFAEPSPEEGETPGGIVELGPPADETQEEGVEDQSRIVDSATPTPEATPLEALAEAPVEKSLQSDAAETAPSPLQRFFFTSPWRFLQTLFGAAILLSGLGLLLLRRRKA